MLKLYSFYHLNMMYSSIEEEYRLDVIKKCYWPILKLAESGIPVGIEASGLTLEYINVLDSCWIKKCEKLINSGKIEFIGSGYSQIIGPLVPATVNKWNQKLGLAKYKELLGVVPKIAMVNELAYSAGLVEHYVDHGYEAIIMEWNNPRAAHQSWDNEWRYNPQRATGCGKCSIPIIWADSIAFQKFQRYVHGQLEIKEYVKYVESHRGVVDRHLPIYSNDAEIFDYRPGRYKTEEEVNNYSEWQRIVELYGCLEKNGWCEFVFPSGVLHGLIATNGGKKIQLESAIQPIPVKKQEKYNVNRWAVTGTNDLDVNSKCYRIYNQFLRSGTQNPNDWRELIYLWSSDFRTHITSKRWQGFIKRMDSFLEKWSAKKVAQAATSLQINDDNSFQEDTNDICLESSKIKVVLNKNRGLSIKDFVSKEICNEPLFGTLEHGYYDDISLGADFYSAHSIIQIPGEHKVSDLSNVNGVKRSDQDASMSFTSCQVVNGYTFNTRYELDGELLSIQKKIQSTVFKKSIVHPINFTFNPEAWDRESLYISTHNGGSVPEMFYLKGQTVTHGDIYSSIISARHGFGNTEGLFIVGDKNKNVTFKCDMSISSLIASIVYKEMDTSYFFRLQYSAQEIDETLKCKQKDLIVKVSVFCS